jgi:hypothetical protein
MGYMLQLIDIAQNERIIDRKFFGLPPIELGGCAALAGQVTQIGK